MRGISLVEAGYVPDAIIRMGIRRLLRRRLGDLPTNDSTDSYRALGRLVAAVKELPRAEFRKHYEPQFMDTLTTLASRGRNANMLQHAAGHLKKQLEGPSRGELADLIHDYRKGLVPLIVPITLLRHHARCHAVDYLNGRSFLEPHPRELMLRNHV